jgi:predicted NUDIX family NTP pyrophosphohydrolase
MYRGSAPEIEVVLVHPGGPFWAGRDAGAWSIPRGRILPGEEELTAARREFFEEVGSVADDPAVELGRFRQPGGKVIVAFAVEGDLDIAKFRSNTFTLEWPPRSVRHAEFPEADAAAWMLPDLALSKIHPGQVPMIEALLGHLA